MKSIWQGVSMWFEEYVAIPLSEVFGPLFEKISLLFSTLWEKIKEIWGKVSDWFEAHVGKPLSNAFTSIWNGIKEVMAVSLNAMIGGIESFLNFVINGINALLSNFNSKVGKAAEFIGAQWSGIELIPSITLPKIEGFYNGGFPEKASLFFANEYGVPELVGTIGGRTAVASGSEITGISDAIYNTAQEEISLLREQNNLLMQLLDKDTSVYIGDKDIARANARGSRALGYALVT